MKIVYDTNQPPEKRLMFIGDKGGKPYYGFRCYQISLDDGIECATIGNWGNAQERRKILNGIKTKEKKK
jgi:hypothetical protein